MAIFLPVVVASLRAAPRGVDALSWCVREACAIALVYSISEVAYASLTLIYRAIGLDPPVFHRNPALSRSVREFWGRRWNRIVGAWLDSKLHRPWARKRKLGIGMALAFFVSALVHVYVTHPALGIGWALVVGAFFLVQGLLALLEGPLGVARWPRLYAHAWTVTVMVTTAPMICEAFLRIAEDP